MFSAFIQKWIQGAKNGEKFFPKSKKEQKQTIKKIMRRERNNSVKQLSKKFLEILSEVFKDILRKIFKKLWKLFGGYIIIFFQQRFSEKF